MDDRSNRLREAAAAVMAHQWSNSRNAMDALTRLVEAAHERADDEAAERKQWATTLELLTNQLAARLGTNADEWSTVCKARELLDGISR